MRSLRSLPAAEGAELAQLPDASRLESLLFQLGLLCELQTQARSAAHELAAAVAGAQLRRGRERSCVDGGTPLLFALRAPGAPRLCALHRDQQSAALWHTKEYMGAEVARRGEQITEVLLGVAEPWARVLAHASSAQRESLRSLDHALCGYGRLFRYSARVDADGRSAELAVTWQLDRQSDAAAALAACGAADALGAAAPILQALLGQQGLPRPLSLCFPLDGRGAVRIGTTAWARAAEEDDKIQRLAHVMQLLAAEPRFARAVYKLLRGARAGDARHRIGRAVEIEVVGPQVLHADFYLSAPSAAD